MAPLPRELSFSVVMLLPALLRVEAPCLLSLDSPRPLCDGSWALCWPSLCAPDRSAALFGIFRAWCAAFCSAACGVLMARTPRLVVPSAAARVLFNAYSSSALGRSLAPRAFFLGYCVASCSAARGARLLPMSGLRVLLRPLGRVLASASLPFAVLIRVAPLCAVFRGCYTARCSSARGPPCGPCVGPWALLRPLCDRTCALCCLLVLTSLSLLCYVRCVAMLLCRLRLYCSLGSVVTYARARRCSPTFSATARGAYAATPLWVLSSNFPLLVLLRCPWGSDVVYVLAYGRPSVPCATALVCHDGYLSAARGRFPAPCAVFLGRRAASYSW